MFRWTLLSMLLVSAIVTANDRSIPTDCGNEKECLIELPGSVCADGTQSFYTLTKREGAKNLLIYMHGGGACWGKQSCEDGYASPLTREEEPTDWINGQGIHNSRDPKNPFASNYNIITVPYCTGDSYTGDRDADYGTPGAPYVIRHRGYRNTVLTLEAIQKQFPTPEKVALVGCSAGGIGVYYHLRSLAKLYPDVAKYVVSDAGTPFRPPHLTAANYERIMKAWGADTTLVKDDGTGKPVTDFGELIRYNTKQFPDVKFSFLSSYNDKTMTFFAWAVGSPSPLAAVKKTIIDVADNFIGDARNSRVFFTEGTTHCFTPSPLSATASQGVTLDNWLTAMMGDSDGQWKSIRPDKTRDFNWKPEREVISPAEAIANLRH